ncbi:MAG: GDP-6-deoxy-D-mannose reductase [Anaerolineales bacterium]|nr:GDP-6-deoxy-D-mannose reductase [Anaerolineales bacterium]
MFAFCIEFHYHCLDDWTRVTEKGNGVLRALITGIAGFAGSHLAEYLLSETDWEIWGTIYHSEYNVGHLRDQLNLRRVDLRDPEPVQNLLREARPDRIYHLAGQPSVPASWQDPWQTFEINVRCQVNLLEAVVAAELAPRVLVVASDEEYGHITSDDLPLAEDTPLRPANPYAVSKVTQDMVGLQYCLNFDLFIVRVRPFNHIGPRQRSEFVAPAFAQQIAEIEAGLRPPVVRVGNLEAERDFTDVRDMVCAYYVALERGETGEVYNIGTGDAHSIRQLLDILLDHSVAQVSVEQDPARMRPSDVPVVVCDATKFRTQTGWAPHISFRESLLDVLNFWRQHVREGVTSNA